MYFSTLAMISFFSLARCATLQSRAASGQATSYGGNLHGGACSFSTYTIPSGMFGTALSDSNWADSGNCGACISVTGPAGNSITAMVKNSHIPHVEKLLNLLPDRRRMSRLRPESSRSLPRRIRRSSKPHKRRHPRHLVGRRLRNYVSTAVAQQRWRFGILVQHASRQRQWGCLESRSEHRWGIDMDRYY
jgi:hypothetical protein